MHSVVDGGFVFLVILFLAPLYTSAVRSPSYGNDLTSFMQLNSAPLKAQYFSEDAAQPDPTEDVALPQNKGQHQPLQRSILQPPSLLPNEDVDRNKMQSLHHRIPTMQSEPPQQQGPQNIADSPPKSSLELLQKRLAQEHSQYITKEKQLKEALREEKERREQTEELLRQTSLQTPSATTQQNDGLPHQVSSQQATLFRQSNNDAFNDELMASELTSTSKSLLSADQAADIEYRNYVNGAEFGVRGETLAAPDFTRMEVSPQGQKSTAYNEGVSRPVSYMSPQTEMSQERDASAGYHGIPPSQIETRMNAEELSQVKVPSDDDYTLRDTPDTKPSARINTQGIPPLKWSSAAETQVRSGYRPPYALDVEPSINTPDLKPSATIGTRMNTDKFAHGRSDRATQTSWPTDDDDACTPTCQWTCASRSCSRTCRPKIKSHPPCEVRCQSMDLSGCLMDCAKPQCVNLCAFPDQCKSPECLQCSTNCTEAMCKLKCPEQQRCRPLCPPPVVEWACEEQLCSTQNCFMKCQHSSEHCPNALPYIPPMSRGEAAVPYFRPTIAQQSSRQFEIPVTVSHGDYRIPQYINFTFPFRQ